MPQVKKGDIFAELVVLSDQSFFKQQDGTFALNKAKPNTPIFIKCQCSCKRDPFIFVRKYDLTNNEARRCKRCIRERPSKHNKQSVVGQTTGTTFTTMYQACNAFGISYKVLKSRIRKGVKIQGELWSLFDYKPYPELEYLYENSDKTMTLTSNLHCQICNKDFHFEVYKDETATPQLGKFEMDGSEGISCGRGMPEANHKNGVCEMAFDVALGRDKVFENKEAMLAEVNS